MDIHRFDTFKGRFYTCRGISVYGPKQGDCNPYEKITQEQIDRDLSIIKQFRQNNVIDRIMQVDFSHQPFNDRAEKFG